MISLGDNETLYLAGGAVLQTAIEIKGDNIGVLGRGVLDGTIWPWRKGPAPNNSIRVVDSSNITIEGIVIRGPWHWTMPLVNSEKINISNVKICGGRVPNDDGINPVNSRDVHIKDCFIRTVDDCIAIKGDNKKWGNVENILIEDTVFWGDLARITLLGHESRAEYMRNIVYRNLDIIHYSDRHPIFFLQPGEDMKMENITFKNIRINGEHNLNHPYLTRLVPKVVKYNHTKIPGHINNVLFENIFVFGGIKPNSFKIYLQGDDDSYRVENVTFKNVLIGDELVRRPSPRVTIGGFADNISFLNNTELDSPLNGKFTESNDDNEGQK
jgi:hypothetical protein